ncbi:DNA-binding transcriptional regulator, AcrR family [Paenibacillus sp. cl141a]|uniref:TetR/AcrR family transcriptional regulator n=1 Tax=Paenibacillus sp. cl141a TaxID=1761877 RepID=UPI0008B32940|nr:TetR/AcrR family transcriptional regulator [Paenibacillus sp. cl141a]SEL29652.1 DNA-binding transcriptional regulator, AcrR family [Paenibacillus sp. cl141a]
MADKTAEKRQQILITAMQLFSAKGSSVTSMQEIAEVCGMSKGSLYLHFKSKEELEKSIYKHIAGRIKDEILRVDHDPLLAPKEKMRKQTEVLLIHFLEIREFLLKQFHDQTPGKPPFDKENMRQEMLAALQWFNNKLKSIYGPDVEPYTMEIAMFMGSMLGAYIRFLFMPGFHLNVGITADHQIQLLDDIVASILRRRPEPLIPMEAVGQLGQLCQTDVPKQRHPLIVIKAMKSELKKVQAEPEEREDAMESLNIMEKELLGLQPSRAVLKGMLANLEGIEEIEALYTELKGTISTVLESYLTPGGMMQGNSFKLET